MRFFVLFMLMTISVQAAPIGRLDVKIVPGIIQIQLPEKADTTTMTLKADERTTHSRVGPAIPYIQIRVDDTASTYTVVLFDDKVTTVAGPSKVVTINPEDFALGKAGGELFRKSMTEAKGRIVFDGDTLTTLTKAQQDEFEKRSRAVMREIGKKMLDAAKARAQGQADAVNALAQ